MEVLAASSPTVIPDGRLAATLDGEIARVLPRQPRTVRDTGLEPRFLTALLVKTISTCSMRAG